MVIKKIFLKPGTFNIKELTWKIISHGRGFVIYHFMGNTHKGIKYTFNYKYNDGHYLNICNYKTIWRRLFDSLG